MKVAIDPARCVTAGLCVAMEPGVFDQDEKTGLAKLLAVEPAEGARERVRDAARTCPGQAITIIEDE